MKGKGIIQLVSCSVELKYLCQIYLMKVLTGMVNVL